MDKAIINMIVTCLLLAGNRQVSASDSTKPLAMSLQVGVVKNYIKLKPLNANYAQGHQLFYTHYGIWKLSTPENTLRVSVPINYNLTNGYSVSLSPTVLSKSYLITQDRFFDNIIGHLLYKLKYRFVEIPVLIHKEK